MPAPIPATNYKDMLMAPTLIGLFQAGKFLPPQLNLVLELEFAEPADALRPGGGSTDYSIENVRVLASQVTLDSALYESYQKILLSGRSLVFAYPTMHTQVSSIPAGSTSHNVTVARAFTKLLGAFVSFRDIDDANLGECSNFEHPGDGSQFSTNALESQMQLGALHHGRRRPRGHQSPYRCARSAGHRQGALAQSGQSSARFHGRRRLRSRGRHFRRRSEAFGCFRLRHLLRGEPLDVLRRLALLRRPLPRSLQQGLHFAGPSDDLGGRHLVGRRRQSRRAPGDAQRPIQPVAAAPQHVHGLVLRDAPRRGRCAVCGARNHLLRGLDAAFAEPASQSRGPGRVQPVVAQGLPGSLPPSSLSGRKDGLVGRGKGTPS